MTTLANGVYTLTEMVGLLDPNFGPAQIIDTLSQMNPIVGRMPMKETNMPLGHQQVLQVTLPSVSVKAGANSPVSPTKGTTTKTVDPLCYLEAWAELDEDAVIPGQNAKIIRAELAQTYLEAMAQKATFEYLYGNDAVTAGDARGLTPRYNSLTTNSAAYPQWVNVINAGGTASDNSSIWVLGLGSGKVCGLYPMGGTAGLSHDDFGLQTIETTAGLGANGARMRAYQERFQWKLGLAIGDWRYAARLCNIDISSLVAETGSGNVDIFKALIKLISRIPIMDARTDIVVLMNRTCMEMLAIQGRTAAGGGPLTAAGNLEYSMVDGKPITRFWGREILVTDQLTEAETLVS